MKKELKRLYVLMAMLCIATTLQAQSILEQKITVSYKSLFLTEVIKDLKKTHKLNFSYANESIKQEKRITLHFKSTSLKTVLEEICKQADLNFIVIENQIILKPNKRIEKKSSANQLNQVIRGRIVDKDTQTPLIGVSVQIISLEPKKGTITDLNGNFSITNVPVGRQHLVVSYMGFETISNPELLLSSGKELVLNLEMNAAVNNLEAIVITDSRNRSAPINSMASVSARSFTTEETSRYAGGVFDPARMVLNFPGVTITDDLSNNIVVRGNTPKNLQWRLEGIEINNPNHFGEEGSSGGGISMISSNMLSKSDFFTGAFPAEYGNALSGVFDLQFRKGNAEQAERSFMIGVLGTEASLEGPFKKGRQSSFLFNYRYSTLGILEKAGIDPAGDNPTPIYQDLAFNLNFPTKKSGAFSLFGIGGIGNQNREAVLDATQWENTTDKFNQKLNYSSFSGGLKHLSMINNKGYFKNIISLSLGSIKDYTDTLDNNYQANNFARDKYVNTALRYSGLLNYKINNKSTLRTGVVSSILGYDLNSTFYKKELGRLSQVINEDGQTYLLEGYGQLNHEFSNHFSINTGFHINYFGLSQKINFEPRFGLNYGIGKNSSINFGMGLHSRVEPMMLYFGKSERSDGSIVISNSNLELTKSAHFVLGFEQNFSDHLKFKVESYYQKMFDVPLSTDPNYPLSTLNVENSYLLYYRNYSPLQNNGTGANYGIEFSLERNLFNGLYFLANSSLYNSTFNTLTGRTFNTSYSGKYSANVVLGKEYQVKENGKNLLGLNIKTVLNGGKRYTPINLQESINDDYPVFYEDQINTLKTEDYYRIDFSMNYRVNRSKVNHFFIIDIQNVTNRQNTYGVFYNPDKREIETVYHAGIIPTFNYKIQF